MDTAERLGLRDGGTIEASWESIVMTVSRSRVQEEGSISTLSSCQVRLCDGRELKFKILRIKSLIDVLSAFALWVGEDMKRMR